MILAVLLVVVSPGVIWRRTCVGVPVIIVMTLSLDGSSALGRLRLGRIGSV